MNTSSSILLVLLRVISTKEALEAIEHETLGPSWSEKILCPGLGLGFRV